MSSSRQTRPVFRRGGGDPDSFESLLSHQPAAPSHFSPSYEGSPTAGGIPTRLSSVSSPEDAPPNYLPPSSQGRAADRRDFQEHGTPPATYHDNTTNRIAIHRRRRLGARDVDPVDSVEPNQSPPESEHALASPLRGWSPVSLQAPLLLSMNAFTLALIVVVWWTLERSEAHQGLMFAPSINDLSFWKSFTYLYLPTLLSVLYGLLWSWIGLDTMRLEPFSQLSRRGGATAKDSVLLDYPFQFIGNALIKSGKHRHWSVFAASVILVLVAFVLTPFQAGLFAIRKVVLQESMASQHATGYTPVDQQEDLNSISAQYVYNIVWLNEAVPPFMAFDYALAPFGPHPTTLTSGKESSNFTASTTMYSLDLNCESPTDTIDSTDAKEYNSTRGCSISGPPENDSDSAGHWDTSKTFRSMYLGHNPEDWNFANWYLYETCPDVCWIRLSERTPEAVAASEDKAISTALFCNPSYYQQQVNATISLSSKQIHSVTPTGDKLDLPPDIFNATHFEYALTSGATSYKIRTNYPSNAFPSQGNKLRDLPLNVNLITPMAGFAISMNKESLDTYMDPQVLHKSYESTYRLLFARQMAQILKAMPDSATENSGQLSLAMEAVQVVPEFAYIVMATLGLVTLFCCWLLFLMMRRRSLLCGDPGSIGALMDLVVTSPNVIWSFFDLGISTANTLRSRFEHRKFVLRGMSSQSLPSLELTVRGHTDVVDRAASVTENSSQQDAARPSELRWFAGIGFLAIQALATGAFIGLYIFAQSHDGIPLPTNGTFVRQLVEKYIPLGVAASIEAFWIVLNRLICLLQPWEALHVGNAKAKRSVDLNYNYLPPQLVFVRALKSRHVKLASICLMAILANVLTVALGGLMYESTASVKEAAQFRQLYEPTLKTTSRPDLSENATKTGWGDKDHLY